MKQAGSPGQTSKPQAPNSPRHQQPQSQPQPQFSPITTRPPKQSSKLAVIVWFIFFFCLAIAGIILTGSQHDTSIYRGKLFHLLKKQKYSKIQKKLELNQKVILIGDQQDGVGIFVNQFLSKVAENSQRRIKIRTFEAGKNLLYKNDNIFLRPIESLKYLLFQSVTPSLWIIRTTTSLTLSDLQQIYQFIKDRLADNIIIVTEAVPQKTSKTYPYFKLIEFKNLDKQEVAQYLLRERQLSQIDIDNIFIEFDDDIGRIDEFIHESEDLDASFAEMYAKQAGNLERLLEKEPKKVEKLLRKMCSRGFEKAKERYEFVNVNNGVVEYDEKEGEYRWKSKKAIFAVSDKYDIACRTDVDFVRINLGEEERKIVQTEEEIEQQANEEIKSNKVEQKSKDKKNKDGKKDQNKNKGKQPQKQNKKQPTNTSNKKDTQKKNKFQKK